MTVTITLSPSELLQLRLQFPSMMQTARTNIKLQLQTRGRALLTAMLGRWQSGELASSLNTSVSGDMIKMSIGAGLEYSQAVFSGAIPHKITAKPGSALHWSRFGRDFFFKSVRHPGQAARIDILLALQELALKIAREETEAIITALSLPGGS